MLKMRLLSGLLPLLCSLLVVHLCYGNTGDGTVVVFKGGETPVSKKESNGDPTVYKPTDFSVPAFVSGEINQKEFLAIICGARLRTSSSPSTYNGVVRTSYSSQNQWSTAEVFTNDIQTSTTHTVGNEFTAVMKKKKIYVLAKGCYKQPNQQNTCGSNKGWEPLLFVGTVSDSTDSGVSGTSITWETGKSFKDLLYNAPTGTQETCFYGGLGNSIVTKSGAIVFPIQINKQGSQGTSSILYSTENDSKWKIGGITPDGTDEGSVVEWKGGKLLLIVSSSGGFRKVFESKDMGSTWEESLVLSRVWGNEESRTHKGTQGSAITVPVDQEDVLLFAHPMSEKGGSSAITLQLWLSDGQRIVRIGTISDSEKEDHTGKSILAHVGNNLYITHEINPRDIYGGNTKFNKWKDVIGFTPLPDFLKTVQTTVHKWRNLDKIYKKKGVPTEGLVGFLGNKKDDEVWTDMYNCVNATVKVATSVDGGFKFNGETESGAEWPVQSQGQNQVYIFTEKQFTLAATVTIHAANEGGQFALIGASLDSLGNKVLLGLGYTHNNKWYVVSEDKKETKTEKTFELDKEYHVALTFAKGKASVYVDGVSITDAEITISSPAKIHHFYMGGIKHSSTAKGSSCTVKNVMLFNQPLLQSETAKLTQVSKESKLEEEETSTALPTLKTEDRTSMSTTQLANIPESSKSVSKSDPKETQVPSLKNAIYEKVKGTKTQKSQPELGDGVLKKDTKGNIDAVMSLSAMSGVALICFFILLAGF